MAASLLLLLAGARAATYYVSTGGDDAAAGTSPDAAWRRLDRVSVLAAGDSVLLRRGDTWVDEQLRLALLAGDGTGAARLSAYGNASLARPAITMSISAGREARACVELLAPTNATVSELRLTGCARGVRVLVPPPPAAPLAALTIESCFFSDIRSPMGSYNPSLPDWAVAIDIAAVGGGGAVNGLTVRHNVGVRMDSFYHASAFVTGLALDANTVAQCQGNCVFLGSGTGMTLSNSVFLRDNPTTFFMYGTTDVILGTISGDNAIVDCDFHGRGEFEGGPDGCAVDFETAASGFRVSGNTFYKSWGAGVMIFGHDSTSQGFAIEGNTFVAPGCVQPRGDRGGVALMCPNGNLPSGSVANNTFVTCAGVPALFENPNVPGCGDNVTKARNTIVPVASGDAVEEGVAVVVPQLSFSPPPPTSARASVSVPLLASTTTPNATLRFTLDGSRPTETSAVLPARGILLAWPGPNLAVNVRGFKAGLLPSVTNGAVVERALYKSRVPPQTQPLLSSLDAQKEASRVHGWVCDHARGATPSQVEVYVDFGSAPVLTATANDSRPDLVTAKVCGDPDHGFDVALPAAVVSALGRGKHVLDVWVAAADSSDALGRPRQRLDGSPTCVCDGAACPC